MEIKKLLALKGWRRRGIAALFGLCAAAALPPFFVLPLLIPAFAGLFLLVTYATSCRQAFFDGWWWGFGYFTAGLYWICISLWIDPEKFAWATPFALFGLPSILSVYIGLVTLLLKAASGKWRVASSKGILVFAALWVAAEYLRAHLFTGFPWNLVGYAFTATDVTLQLASLTGIYGLGWLIVLVATAPVLFVLDKAHAGQINLYTVLLLAAALVFGAVRLESNPTRYTDVKVRIVQANVAQSLKWEPGAALDGLKKHVRLTRSPGLDSVRLVLWPETAVPYGIEPQSSLTHDLGAILPSDALLVTGGMRLAHSGLAWNSVFAINRSGDVVAHYDKHHLVPFGEYIPLRAFIPSRVLDIVAPGMGDFSTGPGPETLGIDPYPPFSPLVCYEAIFPGEATDGTHRAQWLFSLTDDAWFGVSSGPWQDMEMARTRSVEQGLPLLRAANTGVSAATDAYGRILAQLPLEKDGVLDLYLPHEETGKAIYSRWPLSGILFMIATGIGFLFISFKKGRASL